MFKHVDETELLIPRNPSDLAMSLQDFAKSCFVGLLHGRSLSELRTETAYGLRTEGGEVGRDLHLRPGCRDDPPTCRSSKSF